MAAAAVLAAALAACSSQGGAQNQPAGAGGGGGGGEVQTGGKTLTIAMITHEQAGDTFWDKIRAGAEASAKQHGIDLKYSNNEQGPEQATLVQNAIDSKVDGIAITLSSADAVVPVAKKAADAGIPVVAFNQGLDEYKDAGAKMYFGSDELLAGQTIGQKITQEGGGKTLCVIQAQGSVALETRCQGVKEGFAEHREPAGQRGRPALGAADHRRQAHPGPLDHPRRDPGGADRAGRACRPRPTPARPRRRSRST